MDEKKCRADRWPWTTLPGWARWLPPPHNNTRSRNGGLGNVLRPPGLTLRNSAPAALGDVPFEAEWHCCPYVHAEDGRGWNRTIQP